MTRRTLRIGETFKEVLGELLQRNVKDPRIGFMTITSVRVTPDLSKAHVYYTVLGDDKALHDTALGLSSAAPWLRSEVGKQMRLRTTPQLVFHLDDSYEQGLRVDRLLDEIRSEHPDAASDGPAGEPMDDGDAER
jgi:ribosome-binding factor A